MSYAGSLPGKPAFGVVASAALELLKPITWFAPMWAFGCGIVAGGGPSGHWRSALLGIALAGPLVCGTSQAVNDWFDRHVDALNEPARPIPSGRLRGRTGLGIAIVWTLVSLLVAAWLGWVVLVAAAVGLSLAWAYSAPPIRLKRNGWWGNAACGACYEGLPWVTGAAIMCHGVPSWPSLMAALLYSVGAHGIMTLNDFKSTAGDAAMGIRSLPVLLGTERAARLACAVMAVPQIGIIVLLLTLHHPLGAGFVAGVLAAQLWLMRTLLSDPKGKAPWYNGTGTTLYVLGMLGVAFALRGGG